MNRAAWGQKSLRSTLSQNWTFLLGGVISLSLLFSLFHHRSSEPGRWQNTVSSKHFMSVSSSRQNSLRPIENSTLGFERILAISLPERTDHRDSLILASQLSNFTIDFIDGVHGDTIPAKVLPPGPESVLQYPGALGAWRAHMDAIAQVVQSGWGSALIIEDDIDWDVRLRAQLQNIALGADFVIPNLDQHIVTKIEDVQHSHVPKDSPYGDDWDVIWLGHCGMQVADDATIVVIENDDSVPQMKDIISWNGEETQYLEAYPPHTRIVTEQKEGTCSLAYAISQRGARGLLYELGVHKLDGAFDLMLRDFCEGKNGRTPHRCISVLPQIFDHFRRAGSVDRDSDIVAGNGGEPSKEIRPNDFSFTIRWSTRLNLEKLLNHQTDYVDQHPNT